MALSKLAANSFDLTDNYAFTGTTTGASSTQKLFLIKNIDASSSSTVSFVNGSSSVVLDNTYKTYLFKFINLHISNDGADLTFQASTNTGSSYGVTATTTFFGASHGEGGAGGQVSYTTSMDKAQSTDFLPLNNDMGSDNDQSGTGEMYLFNPSSTTFIKHFTARTQRSDAGDYAVDMFIGGYFNTTSAINAIQFKMDAGTIDSGRIALYGIK